MMTKVQALPGVFPLHTDKTFLTESEWVIFKLLCRPIQSLADDDAESLSLATGHQVSVARCDELIRTVQIHQLSGLGSWMSRLLAEVGCDVLQVQTDDAHTLMQKVNEKAGYKICNDATVQALSQLQLQWKGAASAAK
ncbi:MAG: hypothetical protein Q9M10_06215 [Mariprofundaceae bacterium]|nr:hypothetical protein [Mariprofundaceae bacterium]